MLWIYATVTVFEPELLVFRSCLLDPILKDEIFHDYVKGNFKEKLRGELITLNPKYFATLDN